MAITIKLPANFDITATNRFVRGVVSGQGQPTDSKITFDFAPLNFIDGSGYTVLSNTLEWLFNHEVDVRFINCKNLLRPAIRYLDDCGFFHQYIGGKLSSQSAQRPTTLPCTAVAHANAHGWLETKFSPWMGNVLGVSHAALGTVRTGVKELFNNIDDHSTLNTGFIHVQHHPNMKAVRISVSDFGTGIPNTIKARFGDMRDGSAIHMATLEGVTAKTKPNNMGAGLNYLIERVTSCHGKVRIVSLTGSLNCSRAKDGSVDRDIQERNGTYPGTLVEVELDTRLFVGDEEGRVEVEW
jgi:anti-sigma regulatory factor (Ser/Thr protein kinase)